MDSSDLKAEDVPTPVSGASMHREYVRAIGHMAYVWGWPVVNRCDPRAGITQAPVPGRIGGLVPVAPLGRLGMLNDHVLSDQGLLAWPNQGVAYGLGFGSVDTEPIVVQVPEFGERFWIYPLYGGRTDQFGADGSLTLHAGTESPGEDKEPNWLPTPEELFSLYFRCYLADESVLDGTWVPPEINEVK